MIYYIQRYLRSKNKFYGSKLAIVYLEILSMVGRVGHSLVCIRPGQELSTHDGAIAFLFEAPGFFIARTKPVFPVDFLTHCWCGAERDQTKWDPVALEGQIYAQKQGIIDCRVTKRSTTFRINCQLLESPCLCSWIFRCLVDVDLLNARVDLEIAT